jgi:cytidine deaminase
MVSILEKPDAETKDRARLLIQRATGVLQRAYRPYSKFMVASAVMTADGQVFTGTNKETAHYLGSHAEEVALDKMDDAGWRNPILMANVAALDGQPPRSCGCCGHCRQKVYEYASLSGYDIGVVLQPPGEPEPLIVRISNYLPLPFGPADFGVDCEEYRKPSR